jgi:hypothetical protein
MKFEHSDIIEIISKTWKICSKSKESIGIFDYKKAKLISQEILENLNIDVNPTTIKTYYEQGITAKSIEKTNLYYVILLALITTNNINFEDIKNTLPDFKGVKGNRDKWVIHYKKLFINEPKNENNIDKFRIPLLDVIDNDKLHFVGVYNIESGHEIIYEYLKNYEEDLSILLRGLHKIPEQRINDFKTTSKNVIEIVKKTNEFLRNLGQGELIRVVYDVEIGAIYYYLLSAKTCIIGITPNEGKVHLCDKLILELKEKLDILSNYK